MGKSNLAERDVIAARGGLSGHGVTVEVPRRDGGSGQVTQDARAGGLAVNGWRQGIQHDQ